MFYKYRNGSQEMFDKNSCLIITKCRKIHKKAPLSEYFIEKVVACMLIKKILRHWGFPVKFAIFFKNNYSEELLPKL